MSNLTVNSAHCPVYDAASDHFVETAAFWVDGVVKTIVCMVGIVANVLASLILTRAPMRNSFNLLLVTLAIIDTTYLLGAILESFRKRFGLSTDLHVLLFPYVLYPLNKITFTASIFMTVAITLERYVAVHYPLDYNQAMNDVGLMKRRLMRYIGPVLVSSVLFNLTKFFEATVVSSSSGNYRIGVAPLRRNPIYSAYVNWSRLLFLGVVPLALIVFFNSKIYGDVRERRVRFATKWISSHKASVYTASKQEKSDSDNSRPLLEQNSNAEESPEKRHVQQVSAIDDDSCKLVMKDEVTRSPHCPRYPTPLPQKQKDRLAARAGVDNKMNDNKNVLHRLSVEDITTDVEMHVLGETFVASSGSSPISSSFSVLHKSSEGSSPTRHEKSERNNDEDENGCSSVDAPLSIPSSDTISSMKSRSVLKEEDHEEEEGDEERQKQEQRLETEENGSNGTNGISKCHEKRNSNDDSVQPIMDLRPENISRCCSRKSAQNSTLNPNENRRKVEDNLAMVFMGIILAFLICHLPRILLDIHEMLTLARANLCKSGGYRRTFPPWSHVAIHISHLLLAVNAATNMIIYCLLNTRFREEVARVWWQKIRCRKREVQENSEIQC